MKIGVMAGTFDPLHLGHVDFIERTIHEKSLDKVYLLIEKKPRHKPVYASYKDRLKMISLALDNHTEIEVYDCEAETYPISSYLPEIKKSHHGDMLYLLTGQDVADHIMSWDRAEKILEGVELVVAQRNDGITSGNIRNSLANGQKPLGIDKKVLEYIYQNNIYGRVTMSGE